MAQAHAGSQNTALGDTIQNEASEIPVFHYYDSYWNVTVDLYRPNVASTELCFRETPPESQSYKYNCGTGGAYLWEGYHRYPGFCHFYNTNHPFVALPYTMMQAAFEIYARHCFEVDCTEIICNEETCFIDEFAQRDCNYDAHSLRLLLLEMTLETPGVAPNSEDFLHMQKGIDAIRRNFFEGIKLSYNQEIERTGLALEALEALDNQTHRNTLIVWEHKLRENRKKALNLFNFSLGSLCYFLNTYYPVYTIDNIFMKTRSGWCTGFAPDFNPNAHLAFHKN